MRWGANLPSGEKQLAVIGIVSAQIPSVGLKRAAPGNILVGKVEKCSCQASRPQTIVSFLSAHPQVEVSLNIVAIAPGLRVRFQRDIDLSNQASGPDPPLSPIGSAMVFPRNEKLPCNLMASRGIIPKAPNSPSCAAISTFCHLFDCEAFCRLLLTVVDLYRPASTSDCNSQHFVIE